MELHHTPGGTPLRGYIRRWLAKGSSVEELEALANHEHIPGVLSMFKPARYRQRDAQVIGELMAAMNEWQLRRQLPDREFAVELADEEEDHGGLTLMCYQKAPPT